MGKSHLESNTRSFEVTKIVSLVELDPTAFLVLRSKGVCDFHLTEALFDRDFPGHYCRRLKSIGLTIKAGDAETVNATLTQLSTKTVMEADVKAVKYLLDPKGCPPLTIRDDWRASQQLALSQIDPYAENSTGTFNLSFDDERYLPFEGTGAVSSWRLELNGKRNSHIINGLSDVEIIVRYTAYQGGQAFADMVKGQLNPYLTATYIGLPLQFPNEFFAFVRGETETLEINVTRDMFPNMLGGEITAVYSQFEVKDRGQISLVLNEDDSLTLSSGKLLLTESLAIGLAGETLSFKAKGKTLDLVNVDLVFSYKAMVD